MKIEVSNFSKTIKGKTVLDSVSCTFESGKIYGLRGHNGSGKSMLLRAVSGLIKPTEGSVSVDGSVLKRDLEFPESVGLLIDKPSFVEDYSSMQNLRMIASIKGQVGISGIRATLERVGLDPDDKRPFSKYSTGMRQRLGVACAIMEEPAIVLLDEPLNGLDADGMLLIRDIVLSLKDPERIVIVASHDSKELCAIEDETFFLAEGKIVEHAVNRLKEGAGDELASGFSL